MPKGDKNNSKDAGQERTIENRKARYDYAILDSLECGIVLRGSEVKSVRSGNVSLNEGFCRVHGGSTPTRAGRFAKAAQAASGPLELLLYGVHIGEYGPAGPLGSAGQHKATRARRLLAHAREIAKIAKQTGEKGMTIVPLKMYFKNGYAKVLIGVAKGKSKVDKRQSIAKRESDRDIQRAMSRKH